MGTSPRENKSRAYGVVNLPKGDLSGCSIPTIQASLSSARRKKVRHILDGMRSQQGSRENLKPATQRENRGPHYSPGQVSSLPTLTPEDYHG
ncbi:uncharacterized protein LOC127448916 isoform X2 [Myxocyprinus asiaticus]|uniref:uncharacterized protein LOC127448916 isoform X2 n=1 Tax=Myxocyprinus asiaticus TaxID=70543 RepID=UPI0022215649|nr:uncharacterized protein LOC127448916 isoform X2 [Myxocyprinus asiaticus]